MDADKASFWKNFIISAVSAIYRVVKFFISKKNDKDKNEKNISSGE